jgi:hypothetical protein
MTLNLLQWATKWRIPPEALRDLCNTAIYNETNTEQPEGVVQQAVRLGAARSGRMLWRNNRGAGKMANGSFVRYGLANDSKALGDAIKSADLIGIDPVTVTQEMVGSTVGLFLSVEVKREGWKYSGTLEECAQMQWARIVEAKGGRAIITNKSDIFG